MLVLRLKRNALKNTITWKLKMQENPDNKMWKGRFYPVWAKIWI